MTVINRLKDFLNPYKSVSIAPLVMFRIIFGAMMTFGSLRFIFKGWVNELYIQPEFYFGYLGFEWVKPFPGNWMYIPFLFFVISSICIMLGAFYRWSTLLLFISFSYIELLDKSNYLNHYYFISLISFLLIFVPANGFFSLDVKWNRVKEIKQIPLWNIGIFKFQLAIVYIFAGIAKLETDWLINAQPLKIWLQAHRDMPVFGKLLAKEWIAYLFSWFGCIYDLFIVFFLLSKRCRPYAYILVIIFHFVTWYLLPIGIFPWVMIFSTLVFFSIHFHENAIRFLSRLLKYNVSFNSNSKINFPTKKWVSVLLGVYIIFQILIPFRYALNPGNLFWNEEGFRFSWRVMLMHKEGTATFYVKDRKSGGEIEVPNCSYLSPTQVDQMATQPDMILQYAEFLNKKFSDTLLIYGDQKVKLVNPSIHADVFVSLNGRPSQLFISKKHDLTQIPYNFAHRNWLESFKE
jgi:hypothetical protein